MNKRQRKKRLKRMSNKCYLVIDVASFNDCTVVPNEISEFIYKFFNIPKNVMNKSDRYTNLQYQNFLKMNSVIIKEGR